MSQYNIYQAQGLIEYEYNNWIRWGSDKSVKPKGVGSILEHVILPTPKENTIDIHQADAIRFEEIVTSLPDDLKRAFLFYTFRRTYVKGRLKHYHPNELKPWKKMGLSKYVYYGLVRKAFSHITSTLGYGE